MRPGLAEMRRLHHGGERRLDGAPGIGEEGGDARQGLVLLGVEDVQDGADQQGMAGLLPMAALFEAPFGIDQDVGDVLDVAHFPFAAADFKQWIVGRRLGVGRIEQQHAPVPGAEAGGELPVLALDVVDDGRARPGQQRGDHEADALAGTGWRKAQHMLRPVVAEIVVGVTAEHHAIGAE